MSVLRHCAGVALVAISTCASAQSWVPQKNVELEHLFNANKIVPTSLTVVNKPGGGANIANTYVAQRAGDPHYLLIAGAGILSNQIIGASTLTLADFTPIASMTEDYAVFTVAAGSAIKSGRDLIERMKKDTRSVTVGFANAFGSSRHIAAGLVVKAIGGNPRDLRPVVFKGSALVVGPDATRSVAESIVFSSAILGQVDRIDTASGKLDRIATYDIGKMPWWVMTVRLPGN